MKLLAARLARMQPLRADYRRARAGFAAAAVWLYMTVEDAVLMRNFLARFISDEAGVTAIEYGLIGLLIPVACIVGMTLVGTQVQAIYAAISTAVAAAL
jgi:pilus assembly protein Flp/PilA